MSDEIKNDLKQTEPAATESTERRPFKKTFQPRENKDRGARKFTGPKSRTPKKKVCRFCADQISVDYLNIRVLKSYITERAKIVPARISGTCAVHQRHLTVAVKKARTLALIPYTSAHN